MTVLFVSGSDFMVYKDLHQEKDFRMQPHLKNAEIIASAGLKKVKKNSPIYSTTQKQNEVCHPKEQQSPHFLPKAQSLVFRNA